MLKYIILFFIFSAAVLRWLYFRKQGKRYIHIWISAFIQTIPFGYNLKGFYEFVPSTYSNGQVIIGAFGNTISLELSFVFFLILLLILPTNSVNKNFFEYKNMKWYFVFLFFCLISVLNPNNYLPFSSLVLASFFLQLLFFLSLVKFSISEKEILYGIYEGLMVTVFFQLFLSICYPILNIKQVTELFRPVGDFDWTNRRAGYSSALGTFRHPSGLALYSLLMALFFVSCYLNHFRKRLSFVLVLICLFLVFLTFSRTTYIATFVVFSLLYVAFKQQTGLFSIKNIFLGLVLLLTVAGILYLTPLSDLFLKSDSEEQFDNRFNHIALGYTIWNNAPYIGVGINSHVYYMSKVLNTRLFSTVPFFDFLTSNPIHNIHIIVLAETGIVGLMVWIYYLFTRLAIYSKFNENQGVFERILNLAFVGCLISTIVYGLFGWQPFNMEIYTMIIFIGFFSIKPEKKK